MESERRGERQRRREGGSREGRKRRVREIKTERKTKEGIKTGRGKWDKNFHLGGRTDTKANDGRDVSSHSFWNRCHNVSSKQIEGTEILDL